MQDHTESKTGCQTAASYGHLDHSLRRSKSSFDHPRHSFFVEHDSSYNFFWPAIDASWLSDLVGTGPGAAGTVDGLPSTFYEPPSCDGSFWQGSDSSIRHGDAEQELHTNHADGWNVMLYSCSGDSSSSYSEPSFGPQPSGLRRTTSGQTDEGTPGYRLAATAFLSDAAVGSGTNTVSGYARTEGDPISPPTTKRATTASEGRPAKRSPFPAAAASRKARGLPPRPLNSFMLYRRDSRGRALAHLQTQGCSFTNHDVSKLVGGWWKVEPEEVKAKYKQLAEGEKERHKELYPDYKYQPRKVEDIPRRMRIKKDGWVSWVSDTACVSSAIYRVSTFRHQSEFQRKE